MKKLLLSLFLLFILLGIKAQNISGVINNYAPVNAINLNVLTVPSTIGFAVGDKVLIIKMKGALVDQTNTVAYGDTTVMGEVGKYTFSNVIALTPTSLTLSPFCNIFASTQYLQVVTVPIYPNPVVNAPLTCQAWDGSTGGVLIFETPGTLTLNDNIDGSFRGYRGGDVWGAQFSCGTAPFFISQSAFGPQGKKGEGIAEYIVNQECGRGKLASGGGGAFGGNGGAAGGANFGKGGMGGFEYNGCVASGLFAYGGQPIAHSSEALIMGGGGGGPQADNAQQVYNGGNGGAIVFITANQIDGNGFNIISNGESTPQINDEGAPAGGAGGSIYLNCAAYTSLLNVNAKGGNGSSIFNTIFTTNCQGTGGGGGGGLIWFSTGATPGGVNTSTTGGSAGLILNPLSTCFNTTYNAQAGDPGGVNYNFIPTPPPVLPTVNLGPDQLICAGSSLNLDAGAGYASYLWDNSFNGQIRNVNTTGTFYVTVTTISGCTASDTIVVTLDTSVKADFNTTIKLGCDEDTVEFTNNSSAASTQFFWSFGDGNTSTQSNPTHIYATQGIYNVRLIASNPPCYDTIIKTVNLNHPLNAVLALTNVLNSAICLGDPITASSLLSIPDSTSITHSFNWGDNTINNTGNNNQDYHTYTGPGNYTITLTITDTLGCIDTVSENVYVEDSTSINYIVSDDTICVGEPVFFTAILSANTISNTWNFDDGVFEKDKLYVKHTFDKDKTYFVTLKGEYAVCPDDSATIPILVNPYPIVNLGPDTSFCPGLTGSIILNNNATTTATYVWNTGETTSNILASKADRYWVIATTPNSKCSTTDSIWVKRDCYLNIPNAFSPDGDGLNDYFLPREILSSGLRSFRMNIYNRWGENIFTTDNIDGRGWDGKYGGNLQPMGTYIYTIDAEFINNIKKSFKGNVTLIR